MHVVTATDPRPRSGARPSRRTTSLAAALSASLLLAAGAADALAAPDSLTIGGTSAPQATVPMTITARGSSSEPSRLRVFVQQGGGECAAGAAGGAAANAAAEAARAGTTEVISENTSGAFSYAASYTPPAAGVYKVCAYSYRTGPVSSASSQVSQAFSVAAAPAAPASGSPPGSGNPGSDVAMTDACVVPKLQGRMYETARTRLHAAGCIIGKTIRPSKKKAAPLHAGGRRRILKVLSTSPKAGTVLKARGHVTVRLVYVTPKTASSSN